MRLCDEESGSCPRTCDGLQARLQVADAVPQRRHLHLQQLPHQLVAALHLGALHTHLRMVRACDCSAGAARARS